LLVAVDRSKLLPFGSALVADQLAEVRDAVRLGLRFAAAHRALPLDPAARERWIEIYPQLSAGQPGLAGAATARAEAHVVRLALIYALLDCSDTIRIEHLEAAFAVWRYSADSAAWIFGDPTADEIWSAAKERPAGLTRTEVSDMFSRNKETPRDRARTRRARRCRTAAPRTREPDRGRSAEVWIPVPAEAA
jgi:DNA replicative helicase MCM subunit Mcm2 (Cdc46/Mcm family)